MTAGPDYASRRLASLAQLQLASGGHGHPMIVIHTCEGSYSSCWSWLSNTAAQASARTTW